MQRLKNTGAIVLGTTNTPELLMAWETDNLLYGRTNNPWDLERTSGGSSGGEAAAIAAGMSAGGVGSDGGGSIRVPALFSGICGLKPTPGRIPSTGHFPISAGPFAQIGVVGPMARTIADLKILFEVMQGPDVGDSYTAPVAAKSPNGDEVTKLKIAFFADDSRTPVTRETRAAVSTAAQALSSAGFRVEHFRPPGLEEARELWHKYFVVAGGMLLRPMFKGRESDMSPIMKDFLQRAAGKPELDADAVLNAWIQRDLLRRASSQRCRTIRFYCVRLRQFRRSGTESVVGSWKVRRSITWTPGAMRSFFNLLGNPAAVVPVGRLRKVCQLACRLLGGHGTKKKLSVAADATPMRSMEKTAARVLVNPAC